MKYFALASLFLLAGCDSHRSDPIREVGYVNVNYNLTCIKGVTYVVAPHSFSVMLDTQSKVVLCR